MHYIINLWGNGNKNHDETSLQTHQNIRENVVKLESSDIVS